MTKLSTTPRLRVPVKYIEGVWEFSLGGGVPVKPGTEAELLIDRSAITDRNFAAILERKQHHKVLDEGTTLLVTMTIKPENEPSAALRKYLIPYAKLKQEIDTRALEPWNPGTLHFVEVKLAGPDSKQVRRFGTRDGGLWLLTQGIQAVGLASTTVVLPDIISSKPVASLNHAFTKLSETYETWRISHTGNVYTRVLYREKNGRWYPLDLLRNETLDKQEQQIASALWQTFMSKMTASTKKHSEK